MDFIASAPVSGLTPSGTFWLEDSAGIGGWVADVAGDIAEGEVPVCVAAGDAVYVAGGIPEGVMTGAVVVAVAAEPVGRATVNPSAKTSHLLNNNAPSQSREIRIDVPFFKETLLYPHKYSIQQIMLNSTAGSVIPPWLVGNITTKPF